MDFVNKVVRKALHYTYPRTIYEIGFQLGSEAFQPQRAEQLAGRVFRLMVKVNIVQLGPVNHAYKADRTIYLSTQGVQCTVNMTYVRISKPSAFTCVVSCRHWGPARGWILPVTSHC